MIVRWLEINAQLATYDYSARLRIFNHYKGLAHHIVNKFTTHDVSYDDLTQEALLTLWEVSGVLGRVHNPITNHDSFVGQAIKLKMFSTVYKRSPVKTYDFGDNEVEDYSSVEEIEAVEILEHLARTDEDLQVIRCRLANMTYQEIGKIIGVSTAQVAKIVYRIQRAYSERILMNPIE